MELLLICVALIAYGVNYAYSGADNAMFYAARSYLDHEDRIDLNIRLSEYPHIHTVENLQAWGRHLIYAALTLAADTSWTVVFLWAAAWGVSNIASYWFNAFIWQGRQESSSYEQPGIGNVPKIFANNRVVQMAVGFAVTGAALTVWGFIHY